MIEHPATTNVCAVIVSYHPDPGVLKHLIQIAAAQTAAVVLVDNASDGDWHDGIGCALSAAGGALLRQGENIGLAAAQNIGIAWARAHGYSHVLLLDQDSEPTDGMVASLLGALHRLSAIGQVAAVGPRFHDQREHRDAPFVKLGFPLNRKFWCANADQAIACDFLISSGMLIPLDVLDQVGSMEAGLFIDNVDLEWGFRARSRGFAFYGVCGAMLHHRLGDARRSLPWGLGQVVVHGPSRLYYMMRNRLLLYRMPHVPRVWKAQDMLRVPAKLFLFGLLIQPRRHNLRCMLRGLWDGLRGRRGASPSDLSRRG